MNLRRWWPPIAWMGAILTATSIPGSRIPYLGIANIDKVAHLCLYGVFGLLIARAVDDRAGSSRIRMLLLAALVCTSLGVADEWHQKFIPGRSTEVADWVADTTGGLLGAFAWTVFRSRHKVRPT